MNIYEHIIHRGKQKSFAVLVDPDNYDENKLTQLVINAMECKVDMIFVGGSLLTDDHLDVSVSLIKSLTNIPVILFPGSILQINGKADALLLLSLISGRNADMLIGKHVVAAPYLKSSKLEILPTGYMLIESGPITTAQYVSNTIPIPREKDGIAVCTAMAGEMLGLKLIYMDAGSGAQNPVPASMIRKVRENIGIPLVVGGGIRNAEQASAAVKAGADVVVVGNAIEKDLSCMKKIADAVHSS
jgi:putative glycerol-1-phosphate prenyltransferase